MTKERIGFVGAGLMGHGMAKNIMEGGYPLTVIANRNRGPIDDLIGLGAAEATGLQELAEASDVIHICAPGSPQVEAIIEGLIPGLKKGDIIIDCSTADPGSTEMLSSKLATLGVGLVDAPLGGTPVQAEVGELSAMVGGSEADYERVLPIMQCWAKAIVHLGPSGNGHKSKLLMNFISLGYAALYSEALALGKGVGISVEQFDSFIRGSRMDCGFYQTYMGYALEGNKDAHKFTLTNGHKDTRYVTAMGDKAGIANPLGNAVKNSFAMAVNTGGDGPEDYVPHLADFIAKANGFGK